MKKVLLTILTLFLPASAYAAVVLPTTQVCYGMEEAATITAKYKEDVLFSGASAQFASDGSLLSGVMLFTVNQETGSWTLITVYESQYCFVVAGQKFTPQ
jgi:hypothetical protein